MDALGEGKETLFNKADFARLARTVCQVSLTVAKRLVAGKQIFSKVNTLYCLVAAAQTAKRNGVDVFAIIVIIIIIIINNNKNNNNNIINNSTYLVAAAQTAKGNGVDGAVQFRQGVKNHRLQPSNTLLKPGTQEKKSHKSVPCGIYCMRVNIECY